MKPIKLVHSPLVAKANVVTFKKHLEEGRFIDPRRFLSYVQSWYAYVVDGEVVFGPSKFIGYADIDAELYMEESGNNGRLDGRVTEKKLKEWSIVLDEGDENYDEYHGLLSGFCAKYGTSPNSRARISVFTDEDASGAHLEDEVIKAIKLLVAGLSPEGKKTVRKFF